MSSIPRQRSLEIQKTLFETPLKNRGCIRNICGDFVERCTSKLSGGRRLVTDSRYSVCPDLYFAPSTYLECKSVGKANYTIIYKHRWEKENEFCEAGNSIFYWLWRHHGNFKKSQTVESVRFQLSRSFLGVYILERSVLSTLISQQDSVPLNKYYYSNKHSKGTFKGEGWKLHLRDLQDCCFNPIAIMCLPVVGYTIGLPKPVPIFVSSPFVQRLFGL